MMPQIRSYRMIQNCIISTTIPIMNTTKRTQTKMHMNAPVRRPKRCHLCKKHIANDKYNQHFQICYRQQNQKIEESRMKNKSRPAPQRGNYQPRNSIRANTLHKTPNNKVTRPDTANQFRIKSISNNPSAIIHKNSDNNAHATSKATQEKVAQEIKQEKTQKTKEERQNKEREKEEQKREQGGRRESNNQRARNLSLQRPLQSNQGSSQHNPQDEPVVEVLPPAQAVVPAVRVQQTVVREVLFQSQPQGRQPAPPPAPVAEPQEQQSSGQQRLDVTSMMTNSNAIIQFIRATDIFHQDQSLNQMMAQLQQLNMIAQQIVQLNQLGRALAFTIGNAFALRIHQLQTAIIHQIGIALMRGFNGRLGLQFQILVEQQPQLKVGFSPQEIDDLFEEKINILEKECSICLQDMKRSQFVLELQCNHTFHPCCIREWLASSNKCPLCRKVQTQN